MRIILLAASMSLFLSPLALFAQKDRIMDVEISSALLKTADWAGFKYMEQLDLAQSGNTKAIKAMLEFSSVVDGTEALQHATTCLELIPLSSDEPFALAVTAVKPKLRTVLLKRLQTVQSQTKKEDLQKPMQQWAPLTWKALHGEMIICTTCPQALNLIPESTGINPDKDGTSKKE